jgi:hypothetical protein
MYAKSSPDQAFHLLGENEESTLCGLSVAPIIIDRPVEHSSLHLTTNVPTDRPLCHECARHRQQIDDTVRLKDNEE